MLEEEAEDIRWPTPRDARVELPEDRVGRWLVWNDTSGWHVEHRLPGYWNKPEREYGYSCPKVDYWLPLPPRPERGQR